MDKYRITSQDLIDFTWFLAKERGIEAWLRAGETRADLEERVKTGSRDILHFEVEVREEGGRFFVWRV